MPVLPVYVHALRCITVESSRYGIFDRGATESVTPTRIDLVASWSKFPNTQLSTVTIYCVQMLPHKFWVWACSVTQPQRHLTDVYDIFMKSGSKRVKRMWDNLSTLNSKRNMACVVKSLLGQPLSGNCLYPWMEMRGLMVLNQGWPTRRSRSTGRSRLLGQSIATRRRKNIFPSLNIGKLLIYSSVRASNHRDLSPLCMSSELTNSEEKRGKGRGRERQV